MIAAGEWMAVLLPLLQNGHTLRITPSGTSMIPFLTGGRDEAILAPVTEVEKLKRRDIVLYALPDGVHVLHRIHHITEEGIYTLGDFQTQIEGPYPPAWMLAIAKTIVRKGKTISCDDKIYNLLVELWLWLRPFRQIIVRSWQKIKHFRI